MWGNAAAMVPNTTDLSAAELVLTTEGPGHVLLKASVSFEGIVTDEANFITCRQSSRILSVDAPQIRGYIDVDLWDNGMGQAAENSPANN